MDQIHKKIEVLREYFGEEFNAMLKLHIAEDCFAIYHYKFDVYGIVEDQWIWKLDQQYFNSNEKAVDANYYKSIGLDMTLLNNILGIMKPQASAFLQKLFTSKAALRLKAAVENVKFIDLTTIAVFSDPPQKIDAKNIALRQ